MNWRATVSTLAFAAPCLCAPAQAASDHAPPLAKTESGVVRGSREADVESWKGIPFAAPPVGGLRWRAPRPALSWKGVRDATAYSNDCMQLPFPSDAAPLGTTPAENCLYLNVWKPAKAQKRKLPVLFWIHGGGFVNGGSSPPTYSGAKLAEQGILVVSINYRLGRFGFFAHPAFAREDGGKGSSGNYGFLDQIAALGWVRRNIAAFGGDAKNITVMGESAGGMSVHMLLTSPLTRGWFQRAVIMSGGDGRMAESSNPGPAAAERKALAFAAAKTNGSTANVAASLRALRAEDVVDGLNLASFPQAEATYSGPVTDGRVALDLRAAIASGRYNKVPIMIGATSADIGGPSGRMIIGARDLAKEFAEQGSDVFPYCFSYVAQSLARSGARHASDIPFFFDTQAVKYGAATTARDMAMGASISRYIVNFAKTGNPNGSGLPDWPRYMPATKVMMDFAPEGAHTGMDPCAAPPPPA